MAKSMGKAPAMAKTTGHKGAVVPKKQSKGKKGKNPGTKLFGGKK